MNAKPLDARTVAALCVHGRSIYKYLPGVDPYDARRDARTFPGGMSVVAHPPCRHWSKYLRNQAKAPDPAAEMELGRWCVRQVQRWGGVLEHPAGSHLFADMGLPMPDSPERGGCFTIYVEQRWFGFATRKPTWLFVCHTARLNLPEIPLSFDGALYAWRHQSKSARAHTMKPFAEFLVEIARRANPPAVANAPALTAQAA
jgi:hypothetical protein